MRILVTGAAAGIGAAITAAAAARGDQVIATGRGMEALERLWGARAGVWCRQLDVRDAAAWQRLIDDLLATGFEPDVLVNAAGVLRSGATGKLDPSDIDLMLDTNIKGVIHGANSVAAGMMRRGRGHIINIGSLASLYATPGTTVYAASKFAVRGFSIAAAGDLRPHGVAVTLVGPGPVRTAMLERQRGDVNAALTFSGARALAPEEVAAAVLGPVLRRRPIEFFLPAKDAVLGRVCNTFPRFFLGQVKRARARGIRNFAEGSYALPGCDPTSGADEPPGNSRERK